MNKLQEELEHAGHLLCSSLQHYLDTCCSIQKYYQQANDVGGVLRALSASVASQISLIDSLYETNMKHAKSTLGQVVNSSSAIAPINSLPSEILIRIFHLVVHRRPCDVKQKSDAKNRFPKFPDSLSHVCTRWRQIALGSPTLWSDIDFILSSTWSPGLEDRAKSYVARAGNSLLNVHVYEPTFPEIYDISNMLIFLEGIAPRISSLEYSVSSTSSDFDTKVIEFCFHQCEPGRFTELTIMNYGRPVERFIRSADDSDVAHGLSLDVDSEDLENLLLPVTALRLNGVFLPWTHGAYHGLVELRLNATSSNGRTPTISTLELMNILLHSPRLQVLYFGIIIADAVPQSSSISPVRLDDLEVLSLTAKQSTSFGPFLRLISPGPKPLQLSLKFDITRQDELLLGEGTVRAFIARSNIAKLCVRGIRCGTYQSLSEFISPCSNLKVLTMIDVGSYPPTHPGLSLDSYPAPAAVSHLDAMYLIGGRVESNNLEQFIRRHPVNNLVFWKCIVVDQERSPYRQDLQTKFSGICPSVRCIGDEEPSPVEDWYY